MKTFSRLWQYLAELFLDGYALHAGCSRARKHTPSRTHTHKRAHKKKYVVLIAFHVNAPQCYVKSILHVLFGLIAFITWQIPQSFDTANSKIHPQPVSYSSPSHFPQHPVRVNLPSASRCSKQRFFTPFTFQKYIFIHPV